VHLAVFKSYSQKSGMAITPCRFFYWAQAAALTRISAKSAKFVSPQRRSQIVYKIKTENHSTK